MLSASYLFLPHPCDVIFTATVLSNLSHKLWHVRHLQPTWRCHFYWINVELYDPRSKFQFFIKKHVVVSKASQKELDYGYNWVCSRSTTCDLCVYPCPLHPYVTLQQPTAGNDVWCFWKQHLRPVAVMKPCLTNSERIAKLSASKCERSMVLSMTSQITMN